MQRETPVGLFWVKDSKQPTTPEQALMETVPGEEPEESALESQPSQTEQLIELCADVFTEDERDILTMRYVSNLSVRDIGECMGVSKDTIHRRLGPLEAKLIATAKERL